MSSPHAPILAGPKYRELYSACSEGERHYYGVLTAMDEQVGRLRQGLRSLGAADNTMLWFCSDNGPERNDLASARPEIVASMRRTLGEFHNSCRNSDAGASGTHRRARALPSAGSCDHTAAAARVMVVTSRREFIQSLPVSLVAPASTARKPNLLFVFSDQHRACSMPGEPYNDAQAPNLARLAREGLSFTNCISNYPVCSPYRAMLMTGRWPYQTGIIDNNLRLRDEEVSLGEVFARNGYRTGYIGKWHLSPDDEAGGFIREGPARQGFQDWRVWSATNQHFDHSFTFDPNTGRRIQPKGYNGTLMTDTALEFIGNHRNEPWMLMLSWNPPHPIYEDAPPERMKLYNPAALALRPNVKALPGGNAGAQALRRTLQGYYAHITALDAEMGRLLKRLDETGQADRTIVVYTSDHGDMLGSQGFGGKRLPYEESCKTPFLVRYPGVTPAGRTASLLFSALDVYPSLCGLAGLGVPSHCAGKDLSHAMRGHAGPAPESVFLMHIAKDHASGGRRHPAPLFRGVRTGRYTYAVAEDGRWCLFDNQEDPYQMHNLIDDPGCAGLTRSLDGLVLDWLKKAQDPFPYEQSRRMRSALLAERT